MSADSMDDGTAEELDRIKARIESLLAESFDRGDPVYYLSRLGAQLGSDRLKLEKLTGGKLASFVRDRFDYEIGSEGTHDNVLFVKSNRASTNTARRLPPIPRYQPRFWAAFAVPLKDGERRYINLETMNFGGSPNEVAGHDGDVREIEASYIAPGGASGHAAETVERIGRWLKEQGLDGAPFLISGKRARREGRSLLDVMLTALDGDQLKRVSLPMDIVKTLNDHSL